METVAWDVAVRLAKVWDLEVVTTEVPGRDERFVHDGVSVRALPGTRPGRYSVVWWLATARLYRSLDIDAVLGVSAGATAMAWRRRGGTRFYLQAHGTSWAELRALVRSRGILRPHRVLRSFAWLLIDLATYQRYDRIICISEPVRSRFRRFPYRRTLHRKPLELIPNGIPARPPPKPEEVAAARGKLGYGPADRIAICASRLDRQKGVDRAIEALAVSSDQVKLLVVGDGPEATDLRRLAEARGLAGRVTFTGPVSRDTARDLLALADVFVLPARNAALEGLPLSVLEAVHAGLTVVVAQEARWPADLECLLLRVDAAQPDALAAAMEHGRRLGIDRLPDQYRLDHAAAHYHRILSADSTRTET